MNRLWIAILCFAAGSVTVCLTVFAYLYFGAPPVAVADQPFPFEQQIVSFPLAARIRHDTTDNPPLQPTADNLLAGATVYRNQCAICHGLPGSPSQLGQHMYPHVPQLWASHGSGLVGVSDDPASETYWKVKNGIRLTGMPTYSRLLSETQMWQVSLLLRAANKPLALAIQHVLAP